MQDFRKLEIYKRAINYCAAVYKFSSKLPTDEKYGLISQIRRAVSSIAINISEGAGCNTNKEFAVFIGYSYRSCNEVLACLELVIRLELGPKEQSEITALEQEGGELSRMLYAFYKKLFKIG